MRRLLQSGEMLPAGRYAGLRPESYDFVYGWGGTLPDTPTVPPGASYSISQKAARAATKVRSTMGRTASASMAANRVAPHGFNDWLPKRWTHRKTIGNLVLKEP